MKKTSIRRSRAVSIRTRVLTLALVPCIVFLLAGVAGAGYLIYDAAQTRNYFQLASEAQRQSLPLIVSLQEERRLTLRRLASFGTFQSDLIKQRGRTDALAGAATSSLAELSEFAPDSVTRAVTRFTELMGELPTMRARVDGGQVSVSESFSLYNEIIDQFIDGTKGLAQFAPDAEISYLQLVVAPLLTSADLMQRSDALAAANLVGGGLTNSDFAVYQGQVSSYHLQLESTIPLSEPDVQAQYRKLTGSPSWLRLMSVEEVLLRGDINLPISEDLWRSAASEVGDTLMTMVQAQSRHTNDLALSKVNTTLAQSIIAGVLVLALVVAVFLFALRLSRRLIERLVRLRSETLDLAEKGLPELVEKVRTGTDVSVDDEIRLRDYGRDEIGEVADAFNKAQQTAVAAAVQEAKTREGTNKVFLNIAHRSQVIVHRQLKTLDEAERQQEDPEQLELLFQLDHLTTRQRRNAENLIILGGGQPGRRWRNPVSLAEIVRGAAAETEDFARVKTAKLPALTVIGPVVGDLVHLLAELIDNATTFSPPAARVDVRGNVVGRGVVLEIEDQGLGIEPARADDLNDMLANPPDFGIMALSSEPRLGLFVVARLAARHGISVALRESAYGGTRAIVFVRNELLGPDSSAPRDEKPAEPQERPAEQKTETNLRPLDLPATNGEPAANGATVRLTIPGAVSLPDLPPLPVVEPRPGEDLFRPQKPVDAEHEPSQPLRSPRHAEPETSEPSQNGAPTGGPTTGRPPLPKRNAHTEHESSQPVQREPRHVERNGAVSDRPRPVELRKVAPEINRPAPRDGDTRAQAQPQAPDVVQGMAPGRPPLPQRRRQQNLVPQLREDTPPAWPQQSAGETEHNREETPEQARSRLAAFQAGTRRGRDEPLPGEMTNGNDSVGSARNGQHRGE
ncbi:nitrate- and nitrite sensing domain-containing protein [Actinophytocola sp. NPDC049390]|uniref:nitrate- and nitrite sensing domain-containing protein n=1 Tax=Actinophytocola sp. NPDC049390 TaxID=3363894 RepID=UPI0037A1CD70